MYPLNITVKAKNYKCIGEDPQGFESIYPINIIVGRNNSGKSTLLDIMQELTGYNSDFWTKSPNTEQPELVLSKLLDDEQLSYIFQSNSWGGDGFDPNLTHLEYSRRWRNLSIMFNLNGNSVSVIDSPFTVVQGNTQYKDISSKITIPLRGKSFIRLFADRDINTENSTNEPQMNFKGAGCTQIIYHFVNKTQTSSFYGERVLRDALNEIFSPDAIFKEVRVLNTSNGDWEVYLEEEHKGRIALSSSGSGFKTVLLVLVNLLFIPKLYNKKLKEFVFAFEELENNLHPALQRKLLTYIYKIAKEESCCFFLTTHSNVIIDLFSKSADAQIVHVTHDGKTSTAKKITTYIQNKSVLDDLDVRASDLLQSNCLIWVEGPSDRLYFNRWIDLITNGQLKESLHYQCVFYGGRLLAHLSGDSNSGSGIPILKVNRNSILLIDSDKRNQEGIINTTKQRIVSEIENNGGYAWVTTCKEIENYIPASVLNKYYEKTDIREINQFENFSDYLEEIKEGDGKAFLSKKVLFAEKIIPHFSNDDINSFSLGESLEKVIDYICEWNKVNLNSK